MYCDVKFTLLALLILCSDMSISGYLLWLIKKKQLQDLLQNMIVYYQEIIALDYSIKNSFCPYDHVNNNSKGMLSRHA